MKKVKPDCFMWMCPSCKHWNLMSMEQCEECNGVLTETHIYGVRVKDGLTSVELDYYQGSVPLIIQELKNINLLMGKMERHLSRVDHNNG